MNGKNYAIKEQTCHPLGDARVINILGLLKACARQKNLVEGAKLHAYIREHKSLEENAYIASTIVSMYARCGAVAKAQEVFNKLPVRNVVSWNALIAGYAYQGHGMEALKCLDSMQREDHSPDAVTFTCALKACGSIGAIFKGEEIHKKVVSLRMLEKNVVLGSSLVDMYARCGAVTKAQQVLYELPVRNVVTWNALISGYINWQKDKEALECFDCMQHDGHFPDAVSYICALKACRNMRASVKGKEIHDKIVGLGMLEKDAVLGSALVNMYIRCGALATAQQVLEELPIRDVVTWNVLIAGYANQGLGEEALKCFDNMQCDGHDPDVVTFICTLKACGSVSAVAKGEQIHDKIASSGMLASDVMLGNALLDMYIRCGALGKAHQVLEELPIRDVVTWTTLITGYIHQEQSEEALKCFDNLQQEGHSPDAFAFSCVLKACGDVRAAAMGEKIHNKLVNSCMLENDIILGGALVDMYARCGAFAKAQKVLSELPARDVVMWNALITAYTQQGQGEEALKCFDNMQCDGQAPDAITFTCALKACGSIESTSKGKQIHDQIVSLGMLEKDNALGSTLVEMYAKCGALAKAHDVLHELSVRHVVTWNALIAGYSQQGQGEEALKCFDTMLCEGHYPDVFSFTCALKACAAIGAAGKGEQIHDKIMNLGILEKHSVLGNTLVDMYAKCGALPKALEVLLELHAQDVITWNALIAGYALQGCSGEALDCFETMQSDGVNPICSTLVCLLNAFSHSGLLVQAEDIFSRMTNKYGITPNVEHYCCMIDLFGRAGQLEKALLVIEKMPAAECVPVWLALLGACRKWGNVKIGRFAFEHAVHLDKADSAVYLCMTNIYTSNGMQADAEKIELMRVANNAL